MVVLAMVLSTLMYSNVDAVDERKQLMIQVLNNVATESSEKVTGVGIYQSSIDETTGENSETLSTSANLENDIARLDVTKLSGEEVTIKLLSNDSENSVIKEFTYTVTDESKQYCVYDLDKSSQTADQKLKPIVKFGNKDLGKVEYGETVSNTLTTNGVKVKYKSLNNNVASVDDEGKVSLKGIGTATIQAILDKDNLCTGF